MLTPQQCRAARTYMDWTQQDLADRSGVSPVTIRLFEANRKSDRAPRQTMRGTLTLIVLAFEREGFEFFPGGFRRTPP